MIESQKWNKEDGKSFVLNLSSRTLPTKLEREPVLHSTLTSSRLGIKQDQFAVIKI